jgi:hypothetical protein
VVGRQRRGGSAVHADKPRQAARWRRSADQEALAAATGGLAARCGQGRSHTAHSHARDGPASVARAALCRRCWHDRSERRADQAGCPAAPARSWRGAGSDTPQRAATQRTRLRASVLGEEPLRCAQSVAAQGTHPTCQSGTSSPMACRRQARRPDLEQADELVVTSGRSWRGRGGLFRAAPRLVARGEIGLSAAAQTTTSPDHELGDLCHGFGPRHAELRHKKICRKASFAQCSVGIST